MFETKFEILSMMSSLISIPPPDWIECFDVDVEGFGSSDVDLSSSDSENSIFLLMAKATWPHKNFF